MIRDEASTHVVLKKNLVKWLSIWWMTISIHIPGSYIFNRKGCPKSTTHAALSNLSNCGICHCFWFGKPTSFHLSEIIFSGFVEKHLRFKSGTFLVYSWSIKHASNCQTLIWSQCDTKTTTALFSPQLLFNVGAASCDQLWRWMIRKQTTNGYPLGN